jgi:hypothetical protein
MQAQAFEDLVTHRCSRNYDVSQLQD